MISVGHGANLVNAGGGNDVIYGSNTQTEWAAWADNPDRAEFIDERDAHEVLRGGAGSDTIVGGMNMSGQGGNDRLVAALVADTTHMSGGTGADSFVFSDSSQVVGYHAWYVQAEHATISDFSHGEGDRIVIEHADAGTPDSDIRRHRDRQARYRCRGMGLLRRQDRHPGRLRSLRRQLQTPAGLEIEVVGGNITEHDVLFV